jgi:DNA-3-methyladenine glycosylase II
MKINPKFPEYWQEGCNYLSAKDKVLANLIKNYHGESLEKKHSAFYTLFRAIIGQQISVKAADSVWAKFELLFINNLSPNKLIEISELQLKACGISSQKIKYLTNIAEFFITNCPDGNLEKFNHQEVAEQLIAIKGVGRWTVDMFMIFHMHSPDIFPILDIGLLKGFEKNYNTNRKDKKFYSKLEKHSKIWQPYRTIATWYLWRSIDPVVVEY